MPQMLRLALLLAATLMSATAASDFRYDFFRISCISEPSLFSIESVSIWNIHDTVWPLETNGDGSAQLSEWQRRERGMKSLEDRYGLYIFDNQAARNTNEPVACSTDKFKVAITARPNTRDVPGQEVRYRGPMRVAIQSLEGEVHFDQQIEWGSSLKTDGDELEVCIDQRVGPFLDKRTLQCNTRWLDGQKFQSREACHRNEYARFDSAACASEAKAQAENELQRVYGALLEILSADSKKQLIASQAAWKAYQEAHAEFVYESEGDGSAGRMVVANDMEWQIKARTEELRGWLPTDRAAAGATP